VAAISNERLQSLLTPVVEAAGADFEDVKIRKAGSRSVVVVTVDKDGGIDLDTVAAVSRTCSEALDEADVFGETAYVLEVTSPGVDRPLTQARHWRRAKDRLVAIELIDGRRVRGRIGDASDTAAQILTETGVEAVSYSEVARAVVEVEFNTSKGGE
jgi:ribosome maturation factor RimP